jgi:hypothetical protein
MYVDTFIVYGIVWSIYTYIDYRLYEPTAVKTYHYNIESIIHDPPPETYHRR